MLIPDLYLPQSGLQAVAAKYPKNPLLTGRGPPGTHDTALATRVLSEIQSINEGEGKKVSLPIFDKSLCNGLGDRSSETITVEGPLDVFFLEGWSMGFVPLDEEDLVSRCAGEVFDTDTMYTPSHALQTLVDLNNELGDFAKEVYPPFESIIQIEPESYNYVFEWRLEQEHAMKAKNGGRGMTDDQVHAFVERYMPSYELFKDNMWEERSLVTDKPWPWYGRGIRIRYGKNREVIKVERPTS